MGGGSAKGRGGTVGRNLRFVGNGGCGKAISYALRRRGILVATVVALIALSAGAPAQAVGFSKVDTDAVASAGRPADSGSGLANVAVLDVVVLVDESGSETPAKVADEKQTVGTIVQSMLNPASRVTVIGFGGVNHVAPDQNPVDVACQPTIASGARTWATSRPASSKLHRRTEAGGQRHRLRRRARPGDELPQPEHHRHAAVPARCDQGHPDDDRRRRGRAPQHRSSTAPTGSSASRRRSTSSWPPRQADGVQVWPLGFGTDIGTGVTQAQALTT